MDHSDMPVVSVPFGYLHFHRSLSSTFRPRIIQDVSEFLLPGYLQQRTLRSPDQSSLPTVCD